MILKPRRIAQIAVVLIAAVCALSLFLVVNNVSDRLDRAETQASHRDKLADTNAKALKDANAKVTALATQIQALGKEPIVSPKPVTAPGTTTSIGPSSGQVIVALQAYCIAHGECRGPAGAASTVPGPVGPQGVQGLPGATGSAGKDGSSPSDSEIADAIAAYCAAHDGCRGAQGDRGPAGADGAPGPAGPEGPAGPQGPQGPPGDPADPPPVVDLP